LRRVRIAGSRRAGRYDVWSQVQIASREIFAPFWFDAEK